MKINTFVSMVLYLKPFIDKVGSCTFKEIISITDNRYYILEWVVGVVNNRCKFNDKLKD